jgi:hypothetical protein
VSGKGRGTTVTVRLPIAAYTPPTGIPPHAASPSQEKREKREP